MTMDKHAQYLLAAKDEIIKWESQGPGFLSQIADFILWPAQKAAEALIPAGVYDAVGKAIQGFLIGLSEVSVFTVSSGDLAMEHSRRQQRKSKIGQKLEAADLHAKERWNWNLGYAAAEGAATGAVGLPGLAADIPLLFTVAIRAIQEIGFCYGYDVTKPEERDYVLHILQTGASSDIKAKMQFVVLLKQMEQILLKVTWKKMSADLAAREISRLSLMAAIREFAKSLGIQLTKRKALQSVPVIGALVGGSFNCVFVNDISRAAYMSYRRRFVEEMEGKLMKK